MIRQPETCPQHVKGVQPQPPLAREKVICSQGVGLTAANRWQDGTMVSSTLAQRQEVRLCLLQQQRGH